MKTLKITWEEIIKLIEDTYKIKDIKFMKRYGYDGDGEICDIPTYVEGKLNNEKE